LGAPKQEIWMARHKGIIEGVMIGVGAGFDYYAGNIKRAPWLMQVLYLEWLYRLMQDPKRLWKRYVTTNVKFVQLIIMQQRRVHVKQYVK
jgi:N-acetylglucosaminyldiphosphoundecaprenol N-acetyl-beta-D-mannosaminyltransferase